MADQAEKLASVKDHETKRRGPLEIPEAAFRPRQLDSVLQIPLGEWTTLKVGEGQCDVTEACVEAMRAGEACQV